MPTKAQRAVPFFGRVTWFQASVEVGPRTASGTRSEARTHFAHRLDQGVHIAAILLQHRGIFGAQGQRVADTLGNYVYDLVTRFGLSNSPIDLDWLGPLKFEPSGNVEEIGVLTERSNQSDL